MKIVARSSDINYQSDDEIMVKAALRGIKADGITIAVTGELFTIKAK